MELSRPVVIGGTGGSAAFKVTEPETEPDAATFATEYPLDAAPRRTSPGSDWAWDDPGAAAADAVDVCPADLSPHPPTTRSATTAPMNREVTITMPL